MSQTLFSALLEGKKKGNRGEKDGREGRTVGRKEGREGEREEGRQAVRQTLPMCGFT